MLLTLFSSNAKLIYCKLCFLYTQQIFIRYFSGKSETDCCTLYSDHTLINRQNVKADPKDAYRAERDFFLLVIKSRVIVAATKILGMKDKSCEPAKCPLPQRYCIPKSRGQTKVLA